MSDVAQRVPLCTWLSLGVFPYRLDYHEQGRGLSAEECLSRTPEGIGDFQYRQVVGLVALVSGVQPVLEVNV